MGAHTFPKGICQKVNVIARLEYELAAHHFNHYTTRTSPRVFGGGRVTYGPTKFEWFKKNLQVESLQMQPLWIRMDLGLMAMKLL